MSGQGEERPDLIKVGGIVEDHDGPATGQVGPPEHHALGHRLRYLRGWHGQRPEQVVERLGRGERRMTRTVRVKVKVEGPVRVLAGGQASGADRQRRLAHTGHALDYGDKRSAVMVRGEEPEFVRPAHKLGRLGRKAVRQCRRRVRPPRGPACQGRIGAENALVKLG